MTFGLLPLLSRRCLAASCWLLLGFAFPLAVGATDAPHCVRTVEKIEVAQLSICANTACTVPREVKLPHYLDKERIGAGGEAVYTLTLPGEACPNEKMALLFTRVGNQVTMNVNGVDLDVHLGSLGNPDYDASKAPQMVSLRPDLLQRTKAPHTLTLRVTAQPLRWGGLYAVHYGPWPLIQAEYSIARYMRHTSLIVFAVSLGVIGLLALALWARMRDPLFLCFAAAALLGIFRNLDRVWPDVPIPWPWWGGLVSTAYAWHLALMCLFVLMALDLRHPLLRRGIWAYMVCVPLLVAAEHLLGQPQWWTVALVLLVPIGLASWGLAVQCARKVAGKRLVAWALAAAGLLAVAAGLFDLFSVRLALVKNQHSITPHAMFLFVLIMAGIIVDRYARNANGLLVLNHTLEARIAAKERELREAFDQLQHERALQARSLERQRIMRDLHDGVGAQLVGLLNLVRAPNLAAGMLEEHVKAALDEMRLAVDSMQLVDGDLTTALATLRYRLQPRLQAAGLQAHWNVGSMPVLHGMTPHMVLQVQRILLEALTNTLKHASANAVWISCAFDPARAAVVLEVGDDGKGFTPAPCDHPGQGLRNMQARADSIGATLACGARHPVGARVEVVWHTNPKSGV